jgi:hypothetical protein
VTPRAARARAVWLGYWRVMRRYHRYAAVGLEHLTAPGPALIVGYHGRPIAHDLCMLQTLLLDEHGWMPKAVIHASATSTPGLAAVTEGMEFVTGDGDAMAAAVARGDKIIVTPGGTKEGTRSSRDRNRVEWGRRTGYLKLAARYGLPIIPVAGIGVDDTYIGLNNGYAWGKRLKVPGRLPVWVGVGPLGLWPLSPPFPVRISTRIGPPLPPPSAPDPEGWLALHTRVIGAVQALLDAGHPPPWRPHV